MHTCFVGCRVTRGALYSLVGVVSGDRVCLHSWQRMVWGEADACRVMLLLHSLLHVKWSWQYWYIASSGCLLLALMRKVHVALVVCTVPATALQHRNWPERQNNVCRTNAAC